MDDAESLRLLDGVGLAAPPRRNGELVFEHEWEARLFGLTMALHRAGLFVWDDFRSRLIAEIGSYEARHPESADHRYYDRWLAAFERLLLDRGHLGAEELASRVRALAARPPGHDH